MYKTIGGIHMENKILDILENVCSSDEVKADRNINLFEAGLLDSLGIIQLLIDIEEVLVVKIQPTEVQRKQIETPRKIIELILEHK
jgi:D-alanine--poly(phosphoribitol) ligase subunit 2